MDQYIYYTAYNPQLESIERQVSDLIIVGNRVSCNLKCLLAMHDPNYKVYAEGRDQLSSVLMFD